MQKIAFYKLGKPNCNVAKHNLYLHPDAAGIKEETQTCSEASQMVRDYFCYNWSTTTCTIENNVASDRSNICHILGHSFLIFFI